MYKKRLASFKWSWTCQHGISQPHVYTSWHKRLTGWVDQDNVYADTVETFQNMGGTTVDAAGTLEALAYSISHIPEWGSK